MSSIKQKNWDVSITAKQDLVITESTPEGKFVEEYTFPSEVTQIVSNELRAVGYLDKPHPTVKRLTTYKETYISSTFGKMIKPLINTNQIILISFIFLYALSSFFYGVIFNSIFFSVSGTFILIMIFYNLYKIISIRQRYLSKTGGHFITPWGNQTVNNTQICLS